MKHSTRAGLLLATLAFGAAQAQDQQFNITRFQVEGNTLLTAAYVDALVTSYAGPNRVYGDIQRALEALENAYRASGYGTVQVYVPEQELTQGVVRLQVTEGVIGKVNISGNKFFDAANVRATLPSLQEGKAPNMRILSEDIQLANESPAKQIEVTLGVGETDGTVDAKINVADNDPNRFIETIDNTGSQATGPLRIGFSYQNANILDQDQVLTVAYTTSPNAPQGVRVDIYSLAYRMPIYSIGDSVEFLYGKSSVNTPIVQQTGFNLAGKGDVVGLHWNHYFSRQGEYTAKLIAGLDYKFINTTCTISGVPTPIDPPNGGGASCTPYTLRPLSLTYTGQQTSGGQMIDYSLGAIHNLPMGNDYSYTTVDGITGSDRYSMVASNRLVPNGFNYVKGNISYLHALPEDWTLRVAANAQYSATALPSPEQIGIAGSTAVRGFNERAVAGDKGFFANLEIYTPELADLVGATGSLKAIGFYDFGRSFSYGVNRGVQEATYEKAGIGSLGFGLRYALGKDIALKLDFARVMDAGPVNMAPGSVPTNPANTESKGDWRGHFGGQFSF